MATDIAPSLGQGAVLLQAGPGASPGYSAIDIRRALGVGLQEGVIDSGSYMVTERGAGANMTVDIAASTGDGAWVKGDTVASQGLYYVAPHSAVINEAITANSSGNPRVDQVILEILDDTHDAGALNKARIRVLTGTATAAATLDNRSGAAALPNGAVRLADVLVASGAVSISNSSIRDRRPWARGARFACTPTTANPALGTSYAALPELTVRLECSGAPLVMQGYATIQNGSASGNDVYLQAHVDGVAVGKEARGDHFATSGSNILVAGVFSTIPAAGSHTIALYAKRGSSSTATANGTLRGFVVREAIGQSASSYNNSTTSG